MGVRQKEIEDGFALVFVDEAGDSLTWNRRKAWARHGIIPVMRHSFRSWRKLSAQRALVVRKRGQFYELQLVWRLRTKNTVRSKQVIEFLHQCQARVEGPALVIWDNSFMHKSKRGRKCFDALGWERLQLPPYGPEFNADENVWNWTKQQDMANTCPRNRAELIANVRASLRRLANHPAALQWARKNTELDWP